MKKIAILGSTGSIGTQALDVIGQYPDKFSVISLLANNNISLLKGQIDRYKPIAVGVIDEEAAEILRRQVGIRVYSGESAALKIAAMKEYDTLINSLVGLSGIEATLEGIRQKKSIALANKETLVAAGQIVMREVKQNNVKLMPIDSEHSALFQCLRGEKKADIHRLIITCSGGALRERSKEDLEHISVSEALGHRTWSMGKKITIDSATLMNKGFEVIEAMWLYDVPLEKVEVVIHPQSIIHSMVEYSDGSIIAQMSNPDMRLPIQFALSYPERFDSVVQRFDFTKELSFEKPDVDKFPCLEYAFEAASRLGTLPAAMNAANDYLVEEFLNGRARFMDIPDTIKEVMANHNVVENPGLKEIGDAIKESKHMAEKFINKKREMKDKTYYRAKCAEA